MNLVNLGCGSRFHPAWTNVNFVSTGEGVLAHDISKGIPFADASFDVVYHSHLLEHFPKANAKSFIQDCCRVLRPHGILRVAVPDLEQIARTYLEVLENAELSKECARNYDWILLEMYDQVVRNSSGGDMATYLSKEPIANESFVLKRCGAEARNLIAAGHQSRRLQPAPSTSDRAKLLKQMYRFVFRPTFRREILLKRLLGQEYSALQIGRFRQSGEIHQWMYDRYSLACLLAQCGLENIIQRSAAESYVPNWSSFNLDTEPDGTVYKPDSIFMEATKPAI